MSSEDSSSEDNFPAIEVDDASEEISDYGETTSDSEEAEPAVAARRATAKSAGKATSARKAPTSKPTTTQKAVESKASGNAKSRKRKKNTSKTAQKQSQQKGGQQQQAPKEDLMHANDYLSDEEEPRNTIGNVPLWWYNDQLHIGYDLEGKKMIRKPVKSKIDAAIAAKDDPDFKWTVRDARNGQERVLSERELLLIRRIQTGRFAHPEFDAHPDYVPYYTSIPMKTSLHARMPSKAAFIPKKWRRKKVLEMAKAIREGRYSLEKKKKEEQVFLMWGDNDEVLEPVHVSRRRPQRIAAPKLVLPGHKESYRPPAEYLPSEEEKAKIEAMDEEERPTFMPKRYQCLRRVPGYANFLRERFDRCLDLYLATRLQKKKLNIDPQSLIPKLPNPDELRPYPTQKAIEYLGHVGLVRCIAVSPSGEYLCSGGDDGTVRVWEVDSARCMSIVKLDGPVKSVAWSPKRYSPLLAAAVGCHVLLLDAGTSYHDEDEPLVGEPEEQEEEEGGAAASAAQWGDYVPRAQDEDADWQPPKDFGEEANDLMSASRARVVRCVAMTSKAPVTHVAWHRKGDYLVCVCPRSVSQSVVVLQMSRQRAQCPFGKSKGEVQRALFHPSKPLLFVATKKRVLAYHLVEGRLLKKLKASAQWISCMGIHPKGDNLIVGSFDRKLCWFDLDLSSTPFKTLQYHKKAVRQVCFHSRYPLMASASDDGNVHIFHAMVYSDFLQNPLIVPVKILRGHSVTGALGVLDCAFHPSQPWIFTAGADAAIRLFHNMP